MNDDRADLVYAPAVRARIAALFDLLPDDADPAAAEVLFSGWGGPVMDRDFLARTPALRACFYAAGSIRRVVSDPIFWQREVVISSAHVANAEPVADFCLAQIILLLKGAIPGRRGLPVLAPHGTRGAVIGLVSFGTVARQLRARLASLAARVLVYDPYLDETSACRAGVERTSLIELFAASHVVSLHTPLLPETRGLIRAEHLRALRVGAGLINTARGAIIDAGDLLSTLTARPDLTACLDVTEPEPLPPDAPLRAMPNVILTPHLGGSVGTECTRLGESMVEEAERYLRGEPLRWRLDRTLAARMA